jgi:hypothetical protein
MSHPRSRIRRAFRRATLPLAAYYAVTLVLPLVRGVSPSGAFLEHALVVLLVPLMLILAACAVGEAVRGLTSSLRAAPRLRRRNRVSTRAREHEPGY